MELRLLKPNYPQQPLRELLAAPLPCGGRRHCGSCGVLVRGAVLPPTAEETALLQKYSEPPEEYAWRLLCFCLTDGAVEVLLENESVPVTAASQRILPDYDGSADGSIGIAADIGTTTVTVAAYRFPEKEPIAVLSEMNRQGAYGADVISRISGDFFALQALIRTQITDMLARMNINPAEVSRAVITGNTAMLHFFMGLDPAGMGRFPFTPQSLFGEAAAWDALPHAQIYLPPCITAFVGADITCGALAADLHKPGGNALLVDVGTNGEMLLRAGDTLRCCSVAAGPAFEGAEITMGMPALPGTIDKAYAKDGLLHWSAILGAPARGICGTGLISALRAFLELGALESSGAICTESEHAQLYFKDEQPALWLQGSAIMITQRDVRKLQLVKAAIAAGILTIMNESGLRTEQADRLWLAGGFGSYLDPQDAAAIGMLPQGLAERAQAGGNLALRGAEMLLFSSQLRTEALALAKGTEEIPLASHKMFQQEFIEQMSFPDS